MARRPATIEVWTDLECASGSRVAWLAQRVSATMARRLVGSESVEVTIPLTHPAINELQDGRALRVTTADGAVTEWRVGGLEERARARTLTVTALPILLDLGAAGLIRTTTTSPPTYTFAVSRQTPAQLVTGYVLTNLTADGLPWLSAGTIDPTAVLEVAAWARWSRLELLRWIEQQTGAELSLRRDGASGYRIDLLAETGSSATRVRLETGRNVLDLTRTRDSGERVTAVHVVGSTAPGAAEAATVAEVAFAITAKATDVLTLAEPVTGDPMLALDDQLNGLFLQARDGTLVAITDTDATAQTVTVTSGAAFAVGDHVGLRADSAGALVTEVPSGQTPRLVRTLAVPSMRGERNYVVNPLFDDWSSLSAPVGWTAGAGTEIAAEYPRTTPATWTAELDGAVLAGATSVAFRNAVPGSRLYQDERVVVGTSTVVVGNAVVEANASGSGSIVLIGTVSANQPDGAAMSLQTFTGNNNPVRPDPASFPVETYTNNTLRFLSAGNAAVPPLVSHPRWESPAVGLRYLAGPWAQVNVAAAFTVTNGGATTIGNTDSGAAVTEVLADVTTRVLPGVMLIDTSGPTRLAWTAVASSLAPDETLHETVVATHTLTADTTVRVALLPGNDTYFHVCRWVMLWLGPTTLPPQTDGSMANAGWLRGLAALRANSTARAAYQVRLVDLAALGASGDQLALGGPVHLLDAALGLDTTARIVGITYDLEDPANTQVTLDRPAPALSRQV